MHRTIIALVAASQIATGAAAADVGGASLSRIMGSGEARAGAFAGVRLRLPLGVQAPATKPKVSLALAPLVQTRTFAGPVRTRFGEGLALDFTASRPFAFSLAGRPLSGRLAAAEEGEEKKDSTGKKVLKGAAVVAIVAAATVGGLFLAYSIACSDNRCSE